MSDCIENIEINDTLEVKMDGTVDDVNAYGLETLLQFHSDKLCVVLFYAPNREEIAAQAKRMFQSVKEFCTLQGFGDRLYFIQVNGNEDSKKLLDDFEVRLDPTFVIYSDGKEIVRKEHLVVESFLMKLITDNIPF